MYSHSEFYWMGVALGFLFVISILALFKFMKRDRPLKCKYDERQELVRGRGFRYAFFVWLIYGIWDVFFGESLTVLAEHSIITFCGICLGCFVYAAYAIWNDGYFALNEKPWRVVLVFVGLAVVDFALAGIQIGRGDMQRDGRIAICATNLISGVTLLMVVAVVVVKNLYKKRQEDGEL